MPYSCQLQFGTSGRSETPVGAGSTCRAIGFAISQTSRLTMVQTTMRLPTGSLSFGRSTMAEYLTRSRGIVIGPSSWFFSGWTRFWFCFPLRHGGQLELQHADGVAEIDFAPVVVLQLQ